MITKFVSGVGIQTMMNVLHSNSQSAIYLTKNSIFHFRTKYNNLSSLHYVFSWIWDINTYENIRKQDFNWHVDQNSDNREIGVVRRFSRSRVRTSCVQCTIPIHHWKCLLVFQYASEKLLNCEVRINFVTFYLWGI